MKPLNTTRKIQQKTKADRPGGRLSAFVDALNNYVLDPAQWSELTRELDSLGDEPESWNAGELLAQLSRAETLSWQIKQEGELTNSGFFYILLDDRDRVTACSENLPQLGEYLSTEGQNQQLRFTQDSSQQSYVEARTRLQESPRGHILVELSKPGSEHHLYGYLVAENEFPAVLGAIANGASRGLLIAREQPGEKLKNVLQASFGLTAAEAQITLLIARGLTLKQTAGALDISVNTARNHLQAVFDKSGLNRQGDLMLVVTQLNIITAATGADPTSPQPVRATPPSVPPQHFMILADGRRIAYRTYGDPMGYPVVYFHETIGSGRLPPGTDAAARERGLYLIAMERPGYGFSDPDPDLTFESTSNDQAQLLDHLRVQRCALLGFLAGAAVALVFAMEHPDRVDRAMLVAGRPPAPLEGRFSFLMTLRRRMLKRPWLLSTFFNILRNRSSQETNGKLIEGIYGAVPHDQAYLDSHPQMLQHMIDYTMESMTVSAAGTINELQCFNNAIDYTAERLETPVTAWQGTADSLSHPDQLRQFLGDRLTQLRMFDNAGSLILLEHWDAILDELSSGAASR